MSITWKQTMCPVTAPWHPYDQVGCPRSHAEIFQLTVMKGKVRGGVLRFVILGTTVDVRLDHIAVIFTFAQSADLVHTKQCIVQPTLHPPILGADKSERVGGQPITITS